MAGRSALLTRWPSAERKGSFSLFTPALIPQRVKRASKTYRAIIIRPDKVGTFSDMNCQHGKPKKSGVSDLCEGKYIRENGLDEGMS
jgi:hypothetical protein